MTLQQLEDKEVIRDVIDRFSALELDVPEQSKLFTEDTHIEIFMGGKKTLEANGRDEMREKFSRISAKSSYHMNGQQVITLLADDKAEDIHYCKATLVTADEDGNDQLTTNYIRYTDTLVKQNGNWLISSRHQEFIISETHPM